MKFARLVWVNLMRNRRRTILTALSVAVAMFLFATLRSVITALDAAGKVGSESRLVVRSAMGITFALPQAYFERLRAVDGVRSVTWADWFGGVYIEERNFFAQLAVDAETYLPIYGTDIEVPEDQERAFMAERTAALVGRGLMERFGWRLGQTITLQGTIFPGDWDFTIRAVYTPKDPAFGDQLFFFHYAYLFERSRWISPGWYVVQLDDPERAAAVSGRIDGMFENSSDPTKTETERAFNTDFLTMWGNIGFLVRAIGTAVFFAILFVAANTMMMAARERINEVAVLKTLGFTDGLLFGLVLVEALAITLVGGLLGVFAARAFFNPSNPVNNFIPGFSVHGSTVALGLVSAVLLGVVSGLIPAWQAMRLPVVQALRRVA